MRSDNHLRHQRLSGSYQIPIATRNYNTIPPQNTPARSTQPSMYSKTNKRSPRGSPKVWKSNHRRHQPWNFHQKFTKKDTPADHLSVLLTVQHLRSLNMLTSTYSRSPKLSSLTSKIQTTSWMNSRRSQKHNLKTATLSHSMSVLCTPIYPMTKEST